MEHRRLGRTQNEVSVVGLGCWQLGSDWGSTPLSEADGLAILHAAVDAGVTFLDTADNYGDGISEAMIGKFLSARGRDGLTVATKMGQRADPHVAEAYTLENFRAWLDRSRRNLNVDVIDLIQLHCPPTAVYSDDRVYDALDRLVDEKIIAAYGVSVQTCDEALAALSQPRLTSIQIILNVFRRKPLERVIPAAVAAGVAIIARVPLASGLLSGRYDTSTTFAANDHRNYNINGEEFDVGETFSGVPYSVGVEAARQVAELTPTGVSTAQLALRWIIDQPGVTTVIPGARSVQQAVDNAGAGSIPSLTNELQDALRDIYEQDIREHVQAR
ncbi:MAG: aldo/keto reductase, partial [Streptosporangiaceae bacterium]